MPQLKKLLVCLFFLFICTWSFSQGCTDTIRGTLSFSFLGYPTLYQMDPVKQGELIHKLEKKRLSRKDRWFREYQSVYSMLKLEGKEMYPCVEVFSEGKYLILYLPVEAYHQLVEKNSKVLEENQQQVVFQFATHQLQEKYYVLDSLYSVEFEKVPGIRYGPKFAMMGYSW